MGLGGVTFMDKVRVTFKIIFSIWVWVIVRVKVREFRKKLFKEYQL